MKVEEISKQMMQKKLALKRELVQEPQAIIK